MRTKKKQKWHETLTKFASFWPVTFVTDGATAVSDLPDHRPQNAPLSVDWIPSNKGSIIKTKFVVDSVNKNLSPNLGQNRTADDMQDGER